MSQREQFVRFVYQRKHAVTELCAAFGISEKTGHKWLKRYQQEGRSGLADRSHAPHSLAHKVGGEMSREIIALRMEHPTWGAKKLRARLESEFPHITWPAASTIGDVLKREGIIGRSRRRKSSLAGTPIDASLTAAAAPNDVWTTDFKGEFRLGNGLYCYPLTVQDASSRFMIDCTGLYSTASVPVKIIFTRLFSRFGLPQVIRSDNGVPFCSPLALGGLSTLAVWWIRLGIRPERIDRGCPQQNGQHERMHRTLKAEATRPSSSTLSEQQKRFDKFRCEYNNVRPHEALNQKTPAAHYQPSRTGFPDRLPSLEYDPRLEIRRVSSNGMTIFRGRSLWLTKCLAGEDISFESNGEDNWQICFGPLVLGDYHSPTNILIPELTWKPQERSE